MTRVRGEIKPAVAIGVSGGVEVRAAMNLVAAKRGASTAMLVRAAIEACYGDELERYGIERIAPASFFETGVAERQGE